MKLPRFRVRTLLIAVAVVAVLVWSAKVGLRSHDYHRRATEYAKYETRMEEHRRQEPRLGQMETQSADYYARLARNSREAMVRPWMRPTRDLPAPKFEPNEIK
jgi:hypothetical protein